MPTATWTGAIGTRLRTRFGMLDFSRRKWQRMKTAEQLLEKGRSLGFPKVRLSQSVVLQKGEKAWSAYLNDPMPRQIEWLAEAMEHVSKGPGEIGLIPIRRSPS
jgi:hypothetical protein